MLLLVQVFVVMDGDGRLQVVLHFSLELQQLSIVGMINLQQFELVHGVDIGTAELQEFLDLLELATLGCLNLGKFRHVDRMVSCML